MSDKSTALVPISIEQAKEMATTISVSSLLPAALRNKPADVFVTLLAGHELGLAPMQALRSFHVINGKPVMTAELMVALCKRRSDVCKYFQLVESTPESCTYKTQRIGDPDPTSMTWTIEQARIAQLITPGSTWMKHPAAMLRARCSSSLARAVFPDVMLGVLEEDEGREIERNERSVTVDAIDVVAEPVNEESPPPPAPREVDFPIASDAEPLVSFDAVHEAMNRIPQLFGDAKKRERQVAYYSCFGHVGACPARWNPGKEFHGLSPADRAKVLGRVLELAAKLADDLPENLGGTAPNPGANWGNTGTGAPEPAGREPGEEG